MSDDEMIGVLEAVKYEWEQDGLWIHLHTDEGVGTIKVTNLEVAKELLAALDPLRDWVLEADRARSSYVRSSYDEDDAYEVTEPKHSRYHSTMSDLWDSREGK